MSITSIVSGRRLQTMFGIIVLLFAADNGFSQGTGINSDFGRINPEAPIELLQFDFMIGEFARRDRRRNKDGSWQKWQLGQWSARYFMNGFGIFDESLTYDSGVVTSNMRIYDRVAKMWKITWLQAPTYASLTAEGIKKGDEMVLVNLDTRDRYIFSEITEKSYNWTLQILIDGQYVTVREMENTRRK